MTKHSAVYKIPPQDFSPTMEASGCFCIHEDTILLLRRHPLKPYGNTWGIPGGKADLNETARMTAIREIKEEVGFDIDCIDLENIGALYGRLPHLDYVFHMFLKVFKTQPVIDLGLEEHLEARWATLEEALALPLIIGGKEAIEFYREFICRTLDKNHGLRP